MPTIAHWMTEKSLAISAGLEISAGVREHFKDVKGGHKCRLCGEVVKHPRAAAAHLAVHHREALEAYGTSDGANKGWDTRGRGRAKKNFEPPSSVVHKDNSGLVFPPHPPALQNKMDEENRRDSLAVLRKAGWAHSSNSGGAAWHTPPNGDTRDHNILVHPDGGWTYVTKSEHGTYHNGRYGQDSNDLDKFVQALKK